MSWEKIKKKLMTKIHENQFHNYIFISSSLSYCLRFICCCNVMYLVSLKFDHSWKRPIMVNSEFMSVCQIGCLSLAVFPLQCWHPQQTVKIFPRKWLHVCWVLWIFKETRSRIFLPRVYRSTIAFPKIMNAAL